MLKSAVNRLGAILVISGGGQFNHQMTLALKTIGLGNLSTADSHVRALQRLKERQFRLVIFEAKSTDMSSMDFVVNAVRLEPEIVLIAASGQPQIDDVFGLLKAGARGYLSLPFSTQCVEDIIDRAMEGPPFSDSVLQAPDRNSALAGVVLNSLYRLTVLMRQAREFETAKNQVERMKYAFNESMELARLFCEGGEEVFREKIMADCLDRSAAASSRLGRTRQRLKQKRTVNGGEENSVIEEAVQ